jgi:uncharacterized membrane protein YeaQ/YmgE (transglycosylase-associated protein family)
MRTPLHLLPAMRDVGEVIRVHWFGAIIIGLLAGWIAGKLMRGAGFGIVVDIVLGLVGAVIGQWIFDRLGIVAAGGIGFLVMATIGAIILVGAAHLLHGPAHS